MHLIDADNPETRPRLVVARRDGHQYSSSTTASISIIATNSDGAEDFRIVAAPVDAPGEENWREIVAAQAGAADPRRQRVFENFMTRLEREDSLPRIVVTPLHQDDGRQHSTHSRSHRRAHDRALKKKPTRSAELGLRIRYRAASASPIRR